MPESYERMSHDSRLQRFLLDLRAEEIGRDIRESLMEPRLERFIGVIYRPDTERWSHYSSCILPRQYDGWVWFDETRAVSPLRGEQRPGDEETYPFGL
jgi:erythromycin esterase-like protein